MWWVQGILPDVRKVEAIANLPHPKSIAELKRLLSMVNFVNK